MNDKPKLEWTVAKDFTQLITDPEFNFKLDIVVRVSRGKGGLRDHYSIAVGRLAPNDPEGRIITHLPIFARARAGEVNLLHVNAVISGLVMQAERWIQDELQKREDELSEQHEMQRDKQRTNRGWGRRV